MTESSMPSSLAELSSAVLTERLGELIARERCCIVDFLWHLAEMDRRQAFIGMGYRSTFDWCHRALKLAKASCWLRVTSARLLQKFPVIYGYLRDGRLCMSTLVLLHDVLDERNHLELLERAAEKTEDEVKVLVATLQPRPAVPESIRRLPTRRVEAPIEPSPLFAAPSPASTTSPTEPGSGAERKVNIPPVLPAVEVRRPKVEPINATQHSVKFTAGPEFMELLTEAKSVLSHVVPDGNLEAILRECMKKAIEVCAKRQRGATKQANGDVTRVAASAAAGRPPQSGETLETRMHSKRKVWKKRTRYVPAAVRRAVWKRDGGRCTFIGPDGTRCGSTHKLQLDHLQPFALGGKSTVENLTLHCAPHNLHRARLHFGTAHMAKFKRDPARAFADDALSDEPNARATSPRQESSSWRTVRREAHATAPSVAGELSASSSA